MFKIGDRVRFKPEHDHLQALGIGTVGAVGGVGDYAWAEVTFPDDPDPLFDGRAGQWFSWSLELVSPADAPRGPRPLPIRQRVVLTAGKTLRHPSRAVWTQVHSLHSPRTSDGVRPWFV